MFKVWQRHQTLLHALEYLHLSRPLLHIHPQACMKTCPKALPWTHNQAANKMLPQERFSSGFKVIAVLGLVILKCLLSAVLEGEALGKRLPAQLPVPQPCSSSAVLLIAWVRL